MKNASHLFCTRGLTPGCQIQSPALYHVAIKAGLYHKAVQMYYIHIPCNILSLQIEFIPEFLGVWESHEMRLKEFYAHVGYLQRWKNESTPFCALGLNPGSRIQSYALFLIPLKARLYRKTVQVCCISIPSDTFIFKAKVLTWPQTHYKRIPRTLSIWISNSSTHFKQF